MPNLSQIAQSSLSCRLGAGEEGNAGTVLLIHGLGESSRCFQPLLSSPLFPGWTLLAPDLPGYGRSRSSRIRGLHDYSRLLADWILQSEPAPLVVLGHSMGGVIGQYLCRLVPDRVAAFVNVEGNLTPEDCTYSARAAEYSREEFVAAGFDCLLATVAESGRQDPASASYAESMKLCNLAQFHANSLELVEVSGTEHLVSDMEGLSVQTLYLAGLRGRAGSRSLQLLAESRLSWLGFEDSGHWPFIAEPERFIRILQVLLDGLVETGEK